MYMYPLPTPSPPLSIVPGTGRPLIFRSCCAPAREVMGIADPLRVVLYMQAREIQTSRRCTRDLRHLICGRPLQCTKHVFFYEVLSYIFNKLQRNFDPSQRKLFLEGECPPSGKRIYAGIGESISGT